MVNNSKHELHIVIISNGFPNYFNSLDGIFYYDQAIALKKTFPGLKIGFISVNPIGLRDFIKKPNFFKLGRKTYTDQGVYISLTSYLNMSFISNFDIKIANWLYPKRFKRYFKENGKPHIIHVHAFEAGLAAIKLKNEYHVPYVITEHSSKFVNNKLSADQEKIAREVFSKSSLNIAVSNYFAQKLNERFKLSFVTIANLVKMEEFESNEQRIKKYSLINIGTFNDNKNQILVLKTLAKYNFGKVLLVGEGPNEMMLRTFVKENKLEDLVDFLPFQNRKVLFGLIKQSTCLAITSNHETFGVVAIEAMVCGVPVISTKAGGPNDIIVNGINGYLIDSDSNSFYDAFCKISENLSKFAPNALIAYADNNFSEKAIAQKLLISYKSILDKHG